jgi:hypothetical protein
LGSMNLLRRSVDAVRFIAAFYLAVWMTTFLPILWTAQAEYAMDINSATRLEALLCFLPVALANMLIEPYLSFQYAIVSTISVVNPLLLGETLVFVNEQNKMMDHIAFKILHRYMKLTDLDQHDTDDIEQMKGLLSSVFDDWDVHKMGFIDKPTFVHVMHSLGLHLTTHQMGAVFMAIDPDLKGKIAFDGFWIQLVDPLGKAIDLIKSHFSPTTSASLRDLRVDVSEEELKEGDHETSHGAQPNSPTTDSVGSKGSVELVDEHGVAEALELDDGPATTKPQSPNKRAPGRMRPRASAPASVFAEFQGGDFPSEAAQARKFATRGSGGSWQEVSTAPASPSLRPYCTPGSAGKQLFVPTLSGSRRTLVAVGSFATIDDFFNHMTPLSPGNGRFGVSS